MSIPSQRNSPTILLSLNDNDTRIIAARDAEEQLFDHDGFQATAHYIILPEQGISVRVLEIGAGKQIGSRSQ